MMESSNDERDRIATHEAGHAVMYWLWGIEDSISKIDMRQGCVTASSGPECQLNVISSFLMEGNLKGARLLAIRSVMVLMAGFAAEDADEARHSFVSRVGEFYEDYCDQLSVECDLGRAVSASKALHGETGQRWLLFLKLASLWAHEAINDSRVRPVAFALTELLMREEEISGSVAIETMNSASTDLSATCIRLTKLGSHWRRRIRYPKT